MPTDQIEKPRDPLLELGTWIGRRHAFGLISSRCSAADAECLKQLRETEQYKDLGMTWEDFCPRYLRISRVHADRLIAQLDEFGAAYFELSKVIRISPQTFRELGPAVTEDGVSHDGETIPIRPENSSRLAAAVSGIRQNRPVSPVQVLRKVDRMSALLADAADIASALHEQPLPDAHRATLAELLQRGIDRLTAIEEKVRERIPAEVIEFMEQV